MTQTRQHFLRKNADRPRTSWTAEVFGVRVASDLPLWATLAEADGQAFGEADLSIRLVQARPESAGSGPPPHLVDLSQCPVAFWFPGVGGYVVRDGRGIDVTPEAQADPALVALVMRSMAFAVALYQRGRVLLHGSCFVLNGRGVCVAGPSGAGKSTVLASMMARGAQLVSDGLTVLERTEAGFRALPGPPELKLWPDAINHLGGNADAFSPVRSDITKRIFPVGPEIAGGAVPLGRILLLGEGDQERTCELSPSERLFGLVRDAYLAERLTAASQAIVLRGLAQVANAVPVERVLRRRGLQHLPGLLDAIECSVRNGAGAEYALAADATAEGPARAQAQVLE